MQDKDFWKKKDLDAVSREEWEALCDGCARCCLYKLEDEDGNFYFTNVVCRLLNLDTCRCTDYENRNTVMPTCIELNPELARTLGWLPSSCAYYLLATGQPLPDWHPLVSGRAGTVHSAGISILGKAIPEPEVDMDHLEDYIVSSDE